MSLPRLEIPSLALQTLTSRHTNRGPNANGSQVTHSSDPPESVAGGPHQFFITLTHTYPSPWVTPSLTPTRSSSSRQFRPTGSTGATWSSARSSKAWTWSKRWVPHPYHTSSPSPTPSLMVKKVPRPCHTSTYPQPCSHPHPHHHPYPYPHHHHHPSPPPSPTPLSPMQHTLTQVEALGSQSGAPQAKIQIVKSGEIAL